MPRLTLLDRHQNGKPTRRRFLGRFGVAQGLFDNVELAQLGG